MLDGIGAHLEAVRAETEMHEERIAVMTSLAGVPDEEDRHHGHVADHMGSMHDDMDGMGMGPCHSQAADMHHWMDALDEECEQHREAMLGADHVGALHDEEMRHQSWMDAMLETMGAMHDQMQEGCAQQQ